MIELPEAATLARQLAEALAGRTVSDVVANRSPEQFMGVRSTSVRAASAEGERVGGTAAPARLSLSPEPGCARLHSP
jgi:hypothetical protein